MMISKFRRIVLATGVLTGTLSMSFVGSASACYTTCVAGSQTTSSNQTANQQQRLANIKSKGAAEIARRLSSLNAAASKISSSTHLSASDKATLTNEVNSEISGLTTLQTKLANDTTISEASADAKSIISEYRVYALVLPKIWLVKTSDDQQTTESKLTTLETKLLTRVNAAKSSGKDATTLQNDLDDMTTQTTNSQSISTSIEQKVIYLQPTNYDSDHTILSGDAAQLKTAHADNLAALADAKNVVTGLENL